MTVHLRVAMAAIPLPQLTRLENVSARRRTLLVPTPSNVTRRGCTGSSPRLSIHIGRTFVCASGSGNLLAKHVKIATDWATRSLTLFGT